MSQSDAKIIFLEHEPDRQEKLVTMTETSGTAESEGRITALEKRLQDMDALVKALIEELLDFKAIAIMMSKQAEGLSCQEFTEWPIESVASPSNSTPEGSTVIRPKGALQPDVQTEPSMVRIMQSDGTMKFEIRCGDKNSIDGAKGYGRNKNGTR